MMLNRSTYEIIPVWDNNAFLIPLYSRPGDAFPSLFHI